MGYTHFDRVSGINGLYVGANGSEVAVVTSVLTASATWDPASIADGDMEANDVTCTGAALGDFAQASFSLDVEDLVINAAVTAADTVTVVLANNTGGPVDLASGTVSVRVIK